MNGTRVSLGIVCALLLAATSVGVAQDAPGNLAEMWVVVPHDGQAQKFEEAFKAHIAMRAEKGDPRAWQVYQPHTGDDLNRYMIRSCCYHWKEMDSYAAWNEEHGTGDHWNGTVDPHVKSYEHHYAEMDFENSHWPSTDPAAFVGVTYYEIKQGAQVDEDKAALSKAAKEMNWPYEWGWARSVAGSGSMTLAVRYDNFAAMAPPEKGFMARLSEKLGEDGAGKLIKSWGSHFEDTSYTIYRRRADLSMSMPE